jgi:ketosteroid isomerase-like protein
MDVRAVIDSYYRYANAGDWSRWCDLFAADTVVDEQLAGRVTGADTLRSMMAGFPDMYASFANEPVHVLVDGDTAAVVSKLTAVTPRGETIEANVMNYFELRGGEISYMSNYHDTAPFRSVLAG